MQPGAGPLRVVRAALVAAVCVGCSLATHLSAGGGAPSAVNSVGAFLGAAAVAYLLSGRQWTFGRLLLVLGCGQLALHALFGAGDGGGIHGGFVMGAAHLAGTLLLAAALAYYEEESWRVAAAVVSLLWPSAWQVATVDVVPVPAAGRRPVVAGTDEIAAPRTRIVTPSAERAPPYRRWH